MMSNWNGTVLGPPHVCDLDLGSDDWVTVLMLGIIQLQSVHENRIYSLNIHCGPDYPDLPPTLQFISRVNIPCVDPHSGKVRLSLSWLKYGEQQLIEHSQVDPAKLPCLAQWKREYTMETVLIELRRYVCSRFVVSRDIVLIVSGTWPYRNTRSFLSLQRARTSE
jgi:ubiquitin-protein ligase